MVYFIRKLQDNLSWETEVLGRCWLVPIEQRQNEKYKFLRREIQLGVLSPLSLVTRPGRLQLLLEHTVQIVTSPTHCADYGQAADSTSWNH